MPAYGYPAGPDDPSAARPAPGDRGEPRIPRCRRCGERIGEVRGHVCPSCGEGFDLQDPRTFRVDQQEQVLLLHGNAGKVRMAELVLGRTGIVAVVRDDYNAAGGPTAHLWVAREDVDAAVEALAAPPATGTPWTCGCGETHEGQFLACWSCGAEQPTGGAASSAVAAADAGSAAAVQPSPRVAEVPDVDELIEWYAELLGLAPTDAGELPDADADAVFVHEEAMLLVRRWADDETGHETAGGTGGTDPRPVFVLRVDRIESAMDRLIAAGVAFIDDGPVPVPGGRSAVFVDPFGVVHELRDDHAAG